MLFEYAPVASRFSSFERADFWRSWSLNNSSKASRRPKTILRASSGESRSFRSSGLIALPWGAIVLITSSLRVQECRQGMLLNSMAHFAADVFALGMSEHYLGFLQRENSCRFENSNFALAARIGALRQIRHDERGLACRRRHTLRSHAQALQLLQAIEGCHRLS